MFFSQEIPYEEKNKWRKNIDEIEIQNRKWVVKTEREKKVVSIAFHEHACMHMICFWIFLVLKCELQFVTQDLRNEDDSSPNFVSTFSFLCFYYTFVCLLFYLYFSWECVSIWVLQSIEVHTCRSFETTKGCMSERKIHFIIECNDGTNWR